MPRNIYIIGAQCTGKTTLLNALESHLTSPTSPPLSPAPPAIIREVARTVLREVARTVLRDHGFKAHDIRHSPPRALELQSLILQAQARAERHALETADWFISDRSGVDPVSYALVHVGESEAMKLLETDEWGELRQRLADGLLVVCEAGADWLADDGVRMMPLSMDEWREFHVIFCQLLDCLGLDYVVLPATLHDLEDRVQFVLERVS